MISVVITAKDAEATLGEAVESCLQQSYSDFELLLVDNASSDSTRAIVDAIADSRVRVFSCAGSHVEAHRLGIAESSGEFIARMDADDVAHPDRLARQVELLAGDASLSACTCDVRVCSRGRPIGKGFLDYVDWLNGLLTPQDITRERFIESPVVHPAAMMRRQALESVGGYREVEWAEDYDLWLRFLEAGHRIGKVPELLFDWYDSDSRLTRTHQRYTQDQFLRAKAHYLARIPAVRTGGVEICGAGPIGKRIGRLLIGEGVRVGAFYEVNPRRIGETIAGVPVLDQVELQHRGDTVVLGAVGLPGARNLIRGLVGELGFVEGEDFFCVA
ncbi:MAG: glycosyltransferase family 2 protein [Verrucomicrobiales bacterium]